MKLVLLKSLILWSLNTSEAISNMIKESYKQSRHDDDLNQPLSVQPWGKDGEKRRYWLVEGRDDTPFRLYRESNPARSPKNHTWRSVAGTIDELNVVAQKLSIDGTQAGRRLGDRITAAIPRFEATEEKRKRREYRLTRKAQFARPEPGFSMYEGRTRGKRSKYTFSDDDDDDDEGEDDYSLSDVAPRRSARASAQTAQSAGPTITASGRTVRNRVGGLYGEVLHSGQTTGGASPDTNDYAHSDGSEQRSAAKGQTTRSAGRGTLNGWVQKKHIEGYNSVDVMDDEDDATSSGGEWEGGDEHELDGESDGELGDDSDASSERRSYVVTLHVPSHLEAKVSAICQPKPNIKQSPLAAPSNSEGPGVEPKAAEVHRASSPSSLTTDAIPAPPTLTSKVILNPVGGVGRLGDTTDSVYPTPAATTAGTSPTQYSLPYSPQKPANPLPHASALSTQPPPPFAPSSNAKEDSKPDDVQMTG